MNPDLPALPQPSQAAPTSLDVEQVVLLSDAGKAIGTYPKSRVHTDSTPLHLAFSCHVVNDEGLVLVTRRSLSKATWPGVWTNSFCGHPAPEETPLEAVERRAFQELGMEVRAIESILPDFRYRAVDASGVVENEICPVFTAHAVGEPDPSADEVAEWAWIEPVALRASVAAAPFAWSPWLGWQLAAWPEVAGA